MLELSNTCMAERAGFEPAEPKKGSPVFETGPFDRSGTSPPRLRGIGRHGIFTRAEPHVNCRALKASRVADDGRPPS